MSAHDAAYLARQIDKTEYWVKRHANELPHSKAGRTYFWTDADIAAVLEYMRVRPSRDETMSGHARPIPSGRRSAAGRGVGQPAPGAASRVAS